MSTPRSLPALREQRTPSPVGATRRSPTTAYARSSRKLLLEHLDPKPEKEKEKSTQPAGAPACSTQVTAVEKLPALDDELAAFTDAMQKWWPTMKPGDEDLDEAGKVSLAAVDQARDAVRATMGDEPDTEALGKAIEGLEAKLASLQEILDKDRTAPHPRVMVPKLTEMIDALKAVQGGEITGMQRYAVSAGMASLIEAHQRGVAQLLRRSAGGMPRTPIRPRLRDDSIRALPRPGVTGRPVLPKAEPK